MDYSELELLANTILQFFRILGTALILWMIMYAILGE